VPEDVCLVNGNGENLRVESPSNHGRRLQEHTVFCGKGDPRAQSVGSAPLAGRVAAAALALRLSANQENAGPLRWVGEQRRFYRKRLST
jgi:hypothetical protein